MRSGLTLIWHHLRFLVLSAIVVAVFCADSLGFQIAQDIPETSKVLLVTIARHKNVNVSEKDVDQILERANALLSCDLPVRRRGNITILPDRISGLEFNGVVESRFEFQALERAPGDIKLVLKIDVCGIEKDPVIFGDFTGCSSSKTILLARTPSNLAHDAVLWAHELGHMRGLSHTSEPLTLMNPRFESSARRLSVGECEVFRGPKR